MSSREEMETSLIGSLIATYFEVVRQTIQDLVPKVWIINHISFYLVNFGLQAIMHFLVNDTSQQVQNRLVANLYKATLFSELLDEDETLVNERMRVKALLDAYREAFKILSEISPKPVAS